MEQKSSSLQLQSGEDTIRFKILLLIVLLFGLPVVSATDIVLNNPGFETGSGSLSPTKTEGDWYGNGLYQGSSPHTGSYAGIVMELFNYANQSFTLYNNADINISVWAKKNIGTGNLNISLVQYSDDTIISTSNNSLTTTYSNNYLNYSSLAAGTYYISLYWSGGNGFIYLDDVAISYTALPTGTTISGTVYELINGVQSPIPDAIVTIYNSTWMDFMVVGSDGQYFFSNLANSSTYSVYAEKQGYVTTAAFPVTTENGTTVTHNILMQLYISPYVPNFVFEKFVVSGLFDYPYPGVLVDVYRGDETTVLLSGTTDTAGQIVFQLIKDQKYRVNFSGGGLSNNLSYTIYGKEEVYLVTVITGFPSGGDRNEDINATFLVSSFNATYSNISLYYNDNRSSTTSINFTISSINATNSSILTSVCTNSSTSQSVTLNCTAVLASGSYLVNYTAVSSIYGTFHASKVINFDTGKPGDPMIPMSGVSANVLNWISIMLIGLVAALFSIRTVKFGAIIIPSIAMVFWAFGWLNAPFLLISVAFILGVLIYVRMSEVKVNY